MSGVGDRQACLTTLGTVFHSPTKDIKRHGTPWEQHTEIYSLNLKQLRSYFLNKFFALVRDIIIKNLTAKMMFRAWIKHLAEES